MKRLAKQDLVEAWISSEYDQLGLALQKPLEVEHTYRGPQFGHSSTFAYVRLRCEPAPELAFTVEAWPPADVEQQEWEQFCDGIAVAMVNGLMCAPEVPHSRVHVTLAEARCDGMMSNRSSFYRATRGALDTLLTHGSWAWDLPFPEQLSG